MFMDGPTVEIYGNAQDGVGNTMNSGTVIVHGNAGDVLGYGMRRGAIYVEGDVGYRVGIHMKADDGSAPGASSAAARRATTSASTWPAACSCCSAWTRRSSGPIVGGAPGHRHARRRDLLRGEIEPWQYGEEVRVLPMTDWEIAALGLRARDYCRVFGLDAREVLGQPFTRVVPSGSRPYAGLYAYL